MQGLTSRGRARTLCHERVSIVIWSYSRMKLLSQLCRVFRRRPSKIHPAIALLSVPLLMYIASRQLATAQQSTTGAGGSHAALSPEQVVDNLIGRNLERAQRLAAYHGTRVYRLEYRGFPGSRSAGMVVDVTYTSPQTKKFIILSETGSKLLIERVLKKLLQSETEALSEENPRRTALNRDNYKFAQVGYESTATGAVYVLSVEPRTKNKFLYGGRIWVDAKDFAVVRLEGEPAKNPSFWTKDTKVEQIYTKVNDFWLPALNRSTSDIRLGGRADLTIEYKDYHTTAAPSSKDSKFAGNR